MKTQLKRSVKILGAGLGVPLFLYLVLLCFPQPLFAYKFTSGNLTLYCDDPIPLEGAEVLADVQGRLGRSPLYEGRPHQKVFVCNRSWRYKLLTSRSAGGGGLAYAFYPHNVFLRKSDIARNVLFRGDGSTPSGPDRPLSYFIAHEITHNLTSRSLGFWAYSRLPSWKREGYADYVGKGGDFDLEKNLQLLRLGDPALDPKVSGLYLRYHLLTAYLLDRRELTVEEMLRGSFDRKTLEGELLATASR